MLFFTLRAAYALPNKCLTHTAALSLDAEDLSNVVGVLVAAAGEIDEDGLVLGHGGGGADSVRDGVGGLERGDDALDAGELHESVEALLVVDRLVHDAAHILEIAVLGADAGVVEAGGDGVDGGGDALALLKDVALHAVDGAGLAHREGRGVAAGLVGALAGWLNADELDLLVLEESGEHTRRVGAAADAGADDIRRLAVVQSGELLARLLADDRLEVADHHGEGVGADGGANGVEVVIGVCEVLLKRIVDGLLEGRGAAGDGDEGAAEEAHLGDVGVLLLDVDLAHVDLAGDADEGAGGGEGDTVLAGASLGNNLLLVHKLSKQRLAEAVVDLVGAGVVEVLALEVNLSAAELSGEALGVEDGAGAADVVVEEVRELVLEVFALGDLGVGGGDIVHSLLKIRGDELTAVGAEEALSVGHLLEGGGVGSGHDDVCVLKVNGGFDLKVRGVV